MKLVILGAGASYDSNYELIDNDSEQWKPPLGNKLFDTRQNFRAVINSYSGAKALSSDINAIEDIEDYFQSKWDFILKNRADELLAKIINVQYYLQDLLYQVSQNYSVSGLSNYDILMSRAYEYAIKNDEDVCFVTFNYDTLLEKSFEKTFNTEIKNLDQYIDTPIKILKLHGSCNWYRAFNRSFMTFNHAELSNQPEIANFLYNKQFNLQQIYDGLENELVILNTPISRNLFDTTFGAQITKCFFPQIMIPMKDKDEFVLPDEHYEYLTTNLQNINEILIIGWKGAEEHFQKLLYNRIGDKDITITHVNKDKTLEENLSPVLPKAAINHYLYDKDKDVAGTFTSYMKDVINNRYVDFFN